MRTEASAWTAALRHRWQRIEQHRIGGAETVFLARLAREQVWSEARARGALFEYRRFVFLAVASAHRVSPSRAVDAVWHLHLLFTRDYWTSFCGDCLGRPLHHEPETSALQAMQQRTQYAQTCASYRQFFGPPPAAFWPEPSTVARVRPRSRVSHLASSLTRSGRHLASLWRRALAASMTLVLLGLPLRAGAASATNPLDWNGRDFLGLYLGLMLVVGIGSLLLRRILRRGVLTRSRIPGEPDVHEVALLLGGPQRVIDTAVVELHQRGVLRWETGSERFERNSAHIALAPPLDAIADAMTSGSPLRRAWTVAAHTITPIGDRLIRRGLWLASDNSRRIAWLATLPSLALLGFGVSKVGIGISRDKPVALLVVLCVVTAVFALIMAFARPRRSRAGDREAAQLQAMHRIRRQRRKPAAADRDMDLTYAIAIGGTAVLAGTGLAGYHQARAASGTSSGDADSSSDGDSGGGSGCGGCGGGD